jgi:NAD(P)H-hydrate epimerase
MISASRMAAVDRNAAALGVPRTQLMESSGNAIAREVRDLAGQDDAVAIVAGRGNNGGDAFVAARFLDDLDVAVHLLGRPESIRTDIARENWEALEEAEYDTRVVRDSRALDLDAPDLIVDGLLGTGIAGAPREPEASAIMVINASDAAVLSVDVPSGIDADTGETAGVAVDADRVVTFHDTKPGLDALDAEVAVADIGIPGAAEWFVGPGDLLALGRDPESHKGDHGRVFVIGGGPYTGAPALSAQAALRAGADLAYVAAPGVVAETIQGYSEDLIVERYEGERLTPAWVDPLLDRASERDVVVLGPGLGDAPDTLEAVRAFLESYEGLAVIDADALAVVPDLITGATLVCTPHRGELAEMGGSTEGNWRDRAAAVEAFAADLGHTFLLKGAHDVISDGEETRVNRTGNAGMTVGGTGDVLAGATGALLATHEPREAAAIAAYANGRAGDLAVEERGNGLLASDLLDRLPEAMRDE